MPYGEYHRKPEPISQPGGVARPRTCLKCGKLFASQHAGNRICKPCDEKNDHALANAGRQAHQRHRDRRR